MARRDTYQMIDYAADKHVRRGDDIDMGGQFDGSLSLSALPVDRLR